MQRTQRRAAEGSEAELLREAAKDRGYMLTRYTDHIYGLDAPHRSVGLQLSDVDAWLHGGTVEVLWDRGADDDHLLENWNNGKQED